jgi:hypothetical protein
MNAAPHGTIQRAPSPRADLLTFDIFGKILTEDLDWMAKEVDRAFEHFDAVDMLLVMRRFDSAEVGAVIDPKVLKVQFRSLVKVRKYAVVGAPTWVNAMINAFDVVVPVDAGTFDLADEAVARNWMEEDR